MREYFRGKGLDLRRDLVEVVMREVYLCGGHGLAGFVGDRWEQTSVKGLYAAGDCLSNPYGFLVGAMAMGEAAAEHVTSAKEARPSEGSWEEAASQVEETLARHRRGALGASVREFELKFRRLVNEYVAPPKSEAKLSSFLKETQVMLREQENLPVRNPHEIMKVYEAKAGVFLARIAAIASLYRTENPFGLYHQRVDFPERDDVNWKTRLIVSSGPQGPMAGKERP